MASTPLLDGLGPRARFLCDEPPAVEDRALELKRSR